MYKSIAVLVLIGHLSGVWAHEFMNVPKRKRVSLYHIKEEAAASFSEQLRLSAEIIQLASNLQLEAIQLKGRIDDKLDIHLLAPFVMRLHNCRMYYTDLLSLFYDDEKKETNLQNASLSIICIQITSMLGAIQQSIINYLQEIFEEKGSVFIKENQSRLQDVIKTVKMYTNVLKDLCACLSQISVKLSTVKVDA